MSQIISVTLIGPFFRSLKVASVTEHHRLMHPTDAHIVAALDKHHSLDDLLGQEAQIISTRADGETRIMRGVVVEAEVHGSIPKTLSSKIAPTYSLRIRSRLALLEHHIDSRIFQPRDDDKNRTQDIVTKILLEHGFAQEALVWELSADAPSREYCTQYEESSLDFIRRILEEDGISLACITDKEGKEIYEFFDNSIQRKASTGQPVPRQEPNGQNPSDVAVYAFEDSRHYHSGAKARAAFYFEHPELMPRGQAKSAQFDDLESYSGLESFADVATAKALAERRQQAESAQAQLGFMSTNSLEVQPGSQFEVLLDPLDKEPNSYFVTELRTSYRYQALTSGASTTNHYEAEATILAAEVPYRPPLVTPAPQIHGPQSATVVARPGTEAEGVHTDKYGRIKVQFHWDRYGTRDDHSSCWIRVAQLQTSGSMVLPRVHWEVVVEFENGNPDHPLVTGRLFNGLFMPPYELPAGRTRTSLQTASSPAGGGSNEIRFEDAAGSEEVMLHSQYNTSIKVANDRKTNVTKDQTLVVTKNETTTIGSNQTCKITSGCKVTVGANRVLNVSGNHDDEVNAVYGITVGGNQTMTVGGNWTQMVGSPLDAIIALGAAKAAAVASAQAEKVFAEVSGAAQGALDAVSAPVQGLIEQTENISGNMAKVADGKLAAGAAVLTGAVALPTAADVFRNFAEIPAFARNAPGTETSSQQIAVGGAVGAAVSGELQKVGKQLKTAALGEGSASGGGAGGGKSQANQAGPAGDLSGFTAEDMTTGPGFSQFIISGNHEETIAANRIAVTVEPINRNITGTTTQNVAAAHIELIAGDRAESTELAVTESQPALMVVSKGGEVENSNGPRQLTVGAALMETVKGDYAIEAGAAASLTAATHEFKAKSKITLTCGASSITIDGSGVTFQSPAFSLTGSKVAAKKSVADG